jgi:glycosyltransferase involved in cell wall biosynthesis
MRICLDVRHKIRSGASTYMHSLVGAMLRANRAHEFILLELDGSPLEVGGASERIACPRLPALRQYWWIQRNLPTLLEQRGIDAYHTFKHLGPFRTKCKLIYSLSTIGGYSRFFSGVYPMTLAEWVYWGYCARRWLPRLDWVITCTRYIQDYLAEHYRFPRERMTTIPQAPDTEFHPANGEPPVPPAHPRPYILQVGNLFPVKNAQTLVRAFGRLAPRYPDLDLIICGNQSHRYFRDTAALVERLGLTQRVIFKGFAPKADLITLYRQARVFVHPPLHEGFGIALVEGMACGAPTITSDRPALPEVGADAVLRYQPAKDADALATTIERVLRDDTLRADLSRRAVQRAGEFSWNRSARETLAVYDQLRA